MTGRSVGKTALAACLIVAMAGTALAQSNVMQKIRYGEVVSVDETIVEVKAGGSGAQVGATIGAVAGYALTDGRDRWLGGLLGGVLGGAAGKAADRGRRKKKTARCWRPGPVADGPRRRDPGQESLKPARPHEPHPGRYETGLLPSFGVLFRAVRRGSHPRPTGSGLCPGGPAEISTCTPGHLPALARPPRPSS